MNAGSPRLLPGTMECDVLVIGAGPAGSAAARAAASAGASVIMIDRRRTVGVRPQCAGFLPAAAAVLLDGPVPGIAARVSNMQSFFPGSDAAETPSPGYIVDRDIFDQGLAAAAAAAGARICTRTRALRHGGGVTTVVGASGETGIRSSVTIGADGPRSVTGSWIGAANGAFVLAAQRTVPLLEDSGSLRIYFNRRFPGGYGWLFPVRRQARVGIGIAGAVGFKALEALKWFVGELGREGLIEAKTLSATGGLIPVGGPVKVAEGRIMLAGDAAGLCHPVSGAGIALAIQSGILAGEAAAKAASEGDGSAVEGYATEIEERFGGALRMAVLRRRRIYENIPFSFRHAII